MCPFSPCGRRCPSEAEGGRGVSHRETQRPLSRLNRASLDLRSCRFTRSVPGVSKKEPVIRDGSQSREKRQDKLIRPKAVCRNWHTGRETFRSPLKQEE